MADNNAIISHYQKDKDILIKLTDMPGPTVLMPGGGGKDAALLAAAICAGYGKAPQLSPVGVTVATPGGQEIISVLPVTPKDIRHMLI